MGNNVEVKVLAQRVRVCEKRLDKVEQFGAGINDIKISLQEIKDTSANLVKVVEKQNVRLTAIEQKPVKRLEKVENAALAKVGGGLGLVILILIGIIIWLAIK